MLRSPSTQGLPFLPVAPASPKTDFKHRALAQREAESLLKRYPGNTVLTILREVAKQGSSKINWVAIHQRIGAAIKGPREAQAIWRCLAYGHAIPENLAPGVEPLDDDSDIDETDVTKPSTPGISLAMQMDATAWVKNDLRRIGLEVAATGALRRRLTLPSPAARPSNSAPLGTGMRPGGVSPVGSSLLGQKRPSHILTQTSSGSRPGSPGFSGTTRLSPLSSQYSPHVSPHVPQNPSPLGPNKRRHLWSEEEDKTLLEAVQKHGEGHWEEILRQYFGSDRTAAQLMQRWALIRKRPATHPPEAETPTAADNSGREAGRITRSTDSRLRHGGAWGQSRG
ncbi:DNA-binding protein [Klebsormidium nitens]|uniref:DNA-binding protein n=1 Tax=Klebsormidium nitens TaxID=105231 RepID=A0A1Y1HW88_KLENI|nr:DNA-binding protein [Klebsormidium nitens]|eukprot:GAQ82895.1 DNA-binding protein [Klebsormidium nitens]